MAGYTYAQLEGYWESAGGPADVAPIAAAIALAESGGANVKQQGQPLATTGWGLWQITPGSSADLDPQTNAKAAVAKYKAAGNSFSPWVTFNKGTYLQFLQGNVPASNSGTTPTPASTTGLPGFSFPSEITSFFNDGNALVNKLMWLVMPSSWLRIGAFLIGIALLLVAIYALVSVGEGQPIFKMPNIVPVPV